MKISKKIKIDRYQKLAQDLAQHLMELFPQPKKKCWPCKEIRTSYWLHLAFQSGFESTDFLWLMLAPSTLNLDNFANTETYIRKLLVAPLLLTLRGDRAIREISAQLELPNLASYHHWENGNRDIPLAIFLRFLDLQDSKLDIFLTFFNFPLGSRSDRRHFFLPPWTPSVYLMVQTPDFCQQNPANKLPKKIANYLKLTTAQVQLSLQNLIQLRLLHFNGQSIETVKGVHYAGNYLGKDVLDQLNLYWMEQSPFFYQHYPLGFHKIEQAAMSRASMEKVRGWIEELRGKIRQEVQNTVPETVVHFHWQMLDLLAPQEDHH